MHGNPNIKFHIIIQAVLAVPLNPCIIIQAFLSVPLRTSVFWSGCPVCPNQSLYIFVQVIACIPFRPSTTLFRLFWSVLGRTSLPLFRLSWLSTLELLYNCWGCHVCPIYNHHIIHHTVTTNFYKHTRLFWQTTVILHALGMDHIL